jgi:1A family penicillin-binding protein
MAKAKKNRRPRERQPAFYETLSSAVMPPVIPGLREHLDESLAAGRETAARLAQSARAARPAHILRWLRHLMSVVAATAAWLWPRLLLAGLATTNRLLQSLSMLRYAAVVSLDSIAGYTPPIAADAHRYSRRAARTITSRKARTIYLTFTVTGLALVTIAGSVVALKTIQSYAFDISSPAALAATKKTGTVILDRNGQVLFEGYGAQATTPLPLIDLPQNLKDATVAAEDPSFYSNPGFSLRAIARATWVDVAHQGTVEGGSTITQQLVKNALLNSNKDFKRKYQELLLSVELTHRYSKDQILSMYLNDIYYGQGSTGVEAASQTYFHKSARDLTLGESALLAGLPLGPSRFDPNFDLQAATDRRNFVLDRMSNAGKITAAQAKTAKAQPIQLAAAGAPQTAPAGTQPMYVYAKSVKVQAPWFVFYVLQQLRAQYGDDEVEQGGITVKTTLDLSKENAAQQIIAGHVDALAAHHVTNGSLVSLDPHTGDILAMVGSVDYNAPGFGNVNTTLSDLQPGSSFKPIAYATAFKKGWNGATTVDDSPVSFPDGSGGMYTPQNYDGKFHGTVTLRHALDNSLNIPAIKVLQFATIPDTLQTAHDLGITTLNDPSRYGLSLVLGGGEVRPLDMATVYGTLDNGGQRVEPRAILSVTDRHGKDITKVSPPAPAPELDPRIAYMLTNIMADNPARLPEFPAGGPLQLSRPAAAKTGTTNDFRDNWTIGYTPQIVTAVWVGNNDHTPMENVDGITGAAPIWHDYMEMANAGLPVENFTPPAGVVLLGVCSNGAIADGGPGAYQEVFMAGQLPGNHCSGAAPAASPSPTDNPGDQGKKNGTDGTDGSPPDQVPLITPPPAPGPPFGNGGGNGPFGD